MSIYNKLLQLQHKNAKTLLLMHKELKCYMKQKWRGEGGNAGLWQCLLYYTVFSNGEQCEEITSEVSKHVADVLV